MCAAQLADPDLFWICYADDDAKWRLASFRELHRRISNIVQDREKLISNAKRVTVKYKQVSTAANDIFVSAMEKLSSFDRADIDLCSMIDEHQRQLQVLLCLEIPTYSNFFCLWGEMYVKCENVKLM
jgi:hypothetical protein